MRKTSDEGYGGAVAVASLLACGSCVIELASYTDGNSNNTDSDSTDATGMTTKSFALASKRALRKWTAEIKFFPCIEKSQDLSEAL